jgi:hypothetical protein
METSGSHDGSPPSPLSHPLHPVSQRPDLYIDFLDDPIPGRKPGDLGEHEEWWVERQQALEQAGYMLRPRYRLGWKPSWVGTNKFYLDFEDGQPLIVSMNRFFHSLLCS